NPSAPVSCDFLTISCQASRFDSTIRLTITACFGYFFLHSVISFKLTSRERSVISSILFNPISRNGPWSRPASRDETLTIGSPSVFQTAPPQPASKARSTIDPIFVGGALASQNGFGDLIPAKLEVR